MPGNKALTMTAALALGALLGGCESNPMDEWFSTKKPLPGERKPVFTTGVPGVPQGVPPELVRGYQPPPESAPQAVEAQPEKPKPRPRAQPQPQPRQAATPRRAPATEPQQQQQQPPATSSPPAAWPDPQSPQPAQQRRAQQPAPWPD